MAIQKVLLIISWAAFASCEPPVQGLQAPYHYEPPGTNYGTPINYRAPSSNYGAPIRNYNPPNTGYRAPSAHHAAPSTNYGVPQYQLASQGSNYHAPSSGYSAPSTGYGAPSSGDDGSYDHHAHGHDNEVPKSYEFGYSVKDAQSGNDYDRKEVSDGNTVRGEYRVQLPDGRLQIVTYHADWQTGFHADVRYEGEAQYPEQTNGAGGSYLPPHQGSHNYLSPPSDFSGSLTGFHGNNNRPSSEYGPPGY